MSKVEIVSYQESWPAVFEREACSLKAIMGENGVAIHHVGSTAIPGLLAKPIIDILMVVKKANGVVHTLENLGYTYKGELNIPFRQYFTKTSNPVKFHLHVYEEGHPEIQLNLLFRDYLRHSPIACQEYAILKTELLENEQSHKKNNSRFTGYTLGKASFINRILEQAGFDAFGIKFCAHWEEWDVYHRLRKEQRPDLEIAQDDCSDTSFFTSSENHFHFVFYKGIKIIGAAHLDLSAPSLAIHENNASLRFLAIDISYQGQGLEVKFLTLLEKWLHYKNKPRLMLSL